MGVPPHERGAPEATETADRTRGERRRASPRSTYLGVGVGVAGLACAALALGAPCGADLFGSSGAFACKNALTELGRTWGDHRRDAVRDAFVQVAEIRRSETFERVDVLLFDYERAWTAQWEDACRAVENHAQSESVYAAREACLVERWTDADAVGQLLESGDERLIDGVISTVSWLPPPIGCSDVEALSGPTPPPRGPQPAAALRRDLWQARMLMAAGRHREAVQHVAEVEPAFREVGHVPSLAALLVVRARCQLHTGATQPAMEAAREAITLAAQAGLPALEVEANGALAFAILQQEGDAAALTMEPTVRAAATRTDDAPSRAFALGAIAAAYGKAGRGAEALAVIDEAGALLAELPHPPPDDVAALLQRRAECLRLLGRSDEAVAARRAALDVVREGLGASHPSHAALAMQLGEALLQRADLDAALQQYRVAQTACEATQGRNAPDCALVVRRIGAAYVQQGDFVRARESFEDALARYDSAGLSDDVHADATRLDLARASASEGRFEEALRLFSAQRERLAATEGEDSHAVEELDREIAAVRRRPR